MNKQQALNAFWSGFGVLAFEENTVPDDEAIQSLIDAGVAPSKFPYITYQVLTDSLDAPVNPTASIWDRNTSWERSDVLSNQIAEKIQKMTPIKLDDGRMFITTGTPYSQHFREEVDSSIRRVVLNLQVEFFTNY